MEVRKLGRWWSGSIINVRGRCDAIAFVCAMTNIRSCGQIVRAKEKEGRECEWEKESEIVGEASFCVVNGYASSHWWRKCYWHLWQLLSKRLAFWHRGGLTREKLYFCASSFLVLWKERRGNLLQARSGFRCWSATILRFLSASWLFTVDDGCMRNGNFTIVRWRLWWV